MNPLGCSSAALSAVKRRRSAVTGSTSCHRPPASGRATQGRASCCVKTRSGMPSRCQAPARSETSRTRRCDSRISHRSFSSSAMPSRSGGRLATAKPRWRPIRCSAATSGSRPGTARSAACAAGRPTAVMAATELSIASWFCRDRSTRRRAAPASRAASRSATSASNRALQRSTATMPNDARTSSVGRQRTCPGPVTVAQRPGARTSGWSAVGV